MGRTFKHTEGKEMTVLEEDHRGKERRQAEKMEEVTPLE